MGKYVLRCAGCGDEIRERFALSCKRCDALIRTVYSRKKLRVRKLPGIWKFHDWLPVERSSEYSGAPLTYRSEGLAKELGLDSLWISFNGYWPERNAALKTCTFKEYEAAVTLQLAREAGMGSLVIASAGNTAKSFAYMASKIRYPIVLVVPKRCLPDVWIIESAENIRTLVVRDGDYSDSIAVAKKLCAVEGMSYEGGARNVARRDGLGVVPLDAVLKMKRMPKHYFQAAGSGTGGIAVFEAALRLRGDGRFGRTLPKLHLSQNLPFVPMVRAWQAKRRELFPEDIANPNILDLIIARVLSNRYPPYAVSGGVYDALSATKGEMYAVSNSETESAAKLFESLEGIDIVPAAGVGVASLLKAVESGKIKKTDSVLLNITGGGERRLKEDFVTQEIEGVEISKDASLEEMLEALR